MGSRVALLGCGRIAQFFHLPILAARQDCTLLAVADADAAATRRAQAIAPSARGFADWAEALALDGLDAAVICLPPALHAPAAIAAFEAGLHVYVEKPLALTEADARAVDAAWRASGRVGAVGFNFRFHPNFERLRTRLASGELGRLIAVRGVFAAPRRAGPVWKGQRASGGGALRDLAVHHLDLIAHVTGQALSEPSALDRSFNVEGDIVALTARLADGTPAQLFATQATALGENSIELFCEAGRVIADAADPGPRRVDQAPGRFARARRALRLAAELDPRRLKRWGARDVSFERALGAFVTAAAGTAPWTGATIADGTQVAALIEQAECRSAGSLASAA